MDPKLSAGHDLWNLAVKREAVLRNLLQKDAVTAEDVRAGCQTLGIKPALLYRLLARYKNDQRASALLPQKRGRRKGLSSLPDEVDRLIDRAIQSHYLSAQRPRISKLVQFIAAESHKAGLPRPSRTAIVRRVKAIDTRTLLHSREGLKAANDKTRPVTGSLIAERPLQIVQVDHAKVDVLVVDEEHRLPIQRPWLTLLIDVATRMVTGYHLSLEAPSSVSVALALQHSVLPKDEWLAARGISAPWPVHGLPEILHMDNGKEFHAKALKRGAQEYGIKLFYRPIAAPHYGGHIERLIGTMMGEVHLLPGTTFSDVKERGAYDAEGRAAMTLKELDHWLAIQVVGRYHQQIHSALARPPIAVWDELVPHPDATLRHPQDREHFYCDFLPVAERKIGREGVSLFGIKYWDSVLSVWAGVATHKFLVRYDPRDLSSIFVQSPDGPYWQIRYRDLGKPAITLWEYQLARKSLLDQGRREVNESMLFDAIEAQRCLVEEAAARTKSARRRHQRRVEALPPGVMVPENGLIEHRTAEATSDSPVLPYEIEDWS
jgi:putative transposase